MSNCIDQVEIGPPISLGEPVQVRIGQASELLQYDDGRLELYVVSNGSPSIFYAVELPSGNVLYEYEIPNSHAVWGMTTRGHDVYFCATDDGILYRFLADKREVEQVGEFPAGPFVWDMKASSDGKVYGATYPRAELFEYDPVLNQFKDLGRMNDEQHYARSLLTVDDDLFAGIGSEIHLIQYNRTLQTKRELRIEGYTGQKGFIFRIYQALLPHTLFIFTDNHTCLVYDYKQEAILDTFSATCYISKPYNQEHYYVYGSKLYSYNCYTKQHTEHAVLPILEGEKLVKSMLWAQDEHKNDRLVIANTNMEVILYSPINNSVTLCDISVPARTVAIQSLEWDGGERLYIGGYHRGLSIFNTTTEQVDKKYIHFPQIEGMGFSEGKVYFGTYTKANIYAYDPASSANADPYFLFKIGHHQDRPFAITSAEEKMFFGTIADYGLLTGAIAMYNTLTGEYETYPDIVPNQSIIGLAYKDGLIYGGTTNWGGIGIEPTETEAKLFVWDVEKKKLLHSFTPDIPGIDIPPRMIGDLRFGPDGLLWGAVDGTIFAMCTETLTVVKSKLIYPSEYKYTHLRPYFLRWSEDGLLFTALAKKLIVIDPNTLDHKVLEEGPLPLMTVGPHGDIYYNQESELIIRKRLS